MVTKQLADLSAKTALISDSMTQLSVAGLQIAFNQRTIGIENEVQYMKMITEAVVSQVMDVESAKARLIKPYLQEIIHEVISTECQRIAIGTPEKEGSVAQKAPDTTVSGRELEHSSLSANTITNYDRLEVTRAHRATRVYHNAWIGAITVRRITSASKAWRTSMQKYETELEISRTVIQVKFAPWISDTRLDLNLEKLVSLGRAPSLGASLETVKYTSVPSLVYEAIGKRDVNSLCRILVENGVSPKDRSTSDGRSLFDASRVSLTLETYWVDGSSEWLVASRIVKVALWLLSQGIETREGEADQWLKQWIHLGVAGQGYDREVRVREMEQLLVKSTSNSPPLTRARVLVLFSMMNPDHSNELDFAIWDMINEGAGEAELELLIRAGDDFWKSKEDPFRLGMESVVIHSILQLQLTSPKNLNRLEVLRGPRRLILEWLMVMEDPSDVEIWPQYIANLLRLCRSMDILNDGFGEVVAKAACERNLLCLWLEALKLANYSTASQNAMAEHLQAEAHIQPPLMVSLSCSISEDEYHTPTSAILIAGDPHDPSSETLKYLQPCSATIGGPAYHSHSSHPTIDICQVTQSGTELHFSCAITHPDFPAPNPWAPERKHWTDLHAALHHFTAMEPRRHAPEMEMVPIVAPASNSLLSLASHGIAFLTGVS
jgi:hypothetical protein